VWIPRKLESSLREAARTFPVVVLTGPRQVGKTALLEHTFPKVPLVSLDLGTNAEMAESRPSDFLAHHPPPVILDEVQYAPTFFSQLKGIVDRRRGENGLFLLTGSQDFALMSSVAESLAGRVAVVPLLGLSGQEWSASIRPQAQAAWVDFLWRGSYPGLWANPEARPDRDRWYQGYVATYLERDVRNLLNVGSLRDFERFLRACAARCSQTLNVSELARDVGVSSPTVRQWISVLQASNQVLLLEPYHRSLGKRLVKSPKLYFTDTGLAAFLMGFQSAETLWGSSYAGALWECHVVAQWKRWRDWQSPAAGLWYWRDQSGNEVDLLIELNQRLVAVECKLTAKPNKHDLRGIARLRQMYGEKSVVSAHVASTTNARHEIVDGVIAQNGWTVWPLG
jgi:predicted AAA+ superfamily ATPase